MDTHLSHKDEMLLQSLLAGKLPRNLPWAEIIELFGKVGEVQPHGNDEVAFVVGGQRAFFKRPLGHDLATGEVSRLRKFLHEAGLNAGRSQPEHPGRMVVVIDHHGARLYRSLGGQSESETTVNPYDPYNFHHHLIHRRGAHYQGERVPEETSFYEQIAQDLVPAKEILLIGHGTGKSSALDFLMEYLKKHHPTISQRLIGTEIVDLSALTEPEIEALARKHI